MFRYARHLEHGMFLAVRKECSCFLTRHFGHNSIHIFHMAMWLPSIRPPGYFVLHISCCGSCVRLLRPTQEGCVAFDNSKGRDAGGVESSDRVYIESTFLRCADQLHQDHVQANGIEPYICQICSPFTICTCDTACCMGLPLLDDMGPDWSVAPLVDAVTPKVPRGLYPFRGLMTPFCYPRYTAYHAVPQVQAVRIHCQWTHVKLTGSSSFPSLRSVVHTS